LYVDLDLSAENLPPGTRLAIGSAVVEVTVQPHTGCRKFAARYGQDAMKFVNSEEGKKLHMRGINAKIVQGGVVCVGDKLTKLLNVLQ
jgi:MOSC domain-containing protein YiiM